MTGIIRQEDSEVPANSFTQRRRGRAKGAKEESILRLYMTFAPLRESLSYRTYFSQSC